MIKNSLELATHTDLEEIAKLHCACFPRSLSTALGKNYCKKMLSWYIESPNAFMYFIQIGPNLAGYCGGIINNEKQMIGSASSMIQHSLAEAKRAIILRPWLVLHKEFRNKFSLVMKNIFRRKLFKKGEIISEIAQDNKESTGLVVIGVHPNFRGQGVAGDLLNQFELHTLKLEMKKMVLSVNSNNSTAINSYIKAGWKIINRSGNQIKMTKIVNGNKT